MTKPEFPKDSARLIIMRSLLAFGVHEDFRGHEPHDLLESPLFARAQSIMPAHLRLALLQAGRRSPINLHKLLLVPPSENPKTLALFLAGLTVAKQSASSSWLELATKLAERLLSNEKSAWGYPFSWQSRSHFLPKGAPTIVATSFAAGALLDLYRITREESLLRAAEQSSRFVLNEIPSKRTSEGITFGYAPNDPQIVFNASLLGAELLAEVGTLTGNQLMIETAHDAARFVLHHQQADGSWRYGMESNQTWIDSFHTGFVLCSLERIAKYTRDEGLLHAAWNGFKFFREHFIGQDFSPNYFPDKRYPIDAHSAAQAIITLLRFDDRETAERVADRTSALLFSPNGYFYYQVTQRWTNKVPYMRWSNAWMFRALAEFVRPEQPNPHVDDLD